MSKCAIKLSLGCAQKKKNLSLGSAPGPFLFPRNYPATPAEAMDFSECSWMYSICTMEPSQLTAKRAQEVNENNEKDLVVEKDQSSWHGSWYIQWALGFEL